jgi:drug/metabolite transporter (DMT)-like permease
LLSSYTLALRWRPAGLDALSFLAYFALVALAPVGVFMLGELAAGLRMVVNAQTIAALAFVAIFPALLAYHFWNLGVAKAGAARAGVFMYLLPVFGAVLSVAFLGERFELYHAVGMALIFAGVAIAARGKA